jgi:hypothetical protein
MGSVQPRICYSLYCSLNDDVPSDYVYFQFVVRYTNRSHQWYAYPLLLLCAHERVVLTTAVAVESMTSITRVVTQRIATTGSMSNFLESVNPDVVSTLLAKKIILLSRKLESVDDVIDHLYAHSPPLLRACWPYLIFCRSRTHTGTRR